MKTGSARILLIEDDADLASGLIDALRIEGYTVTHVADGKRGLEEALSGAYDLIILDEMLPGLSGFEILRKARAQSSKAAILMLTARGQEIDRVRGLKIGADDYVTKPFSLMELLARIGALLRRASDSRHTESVEIGEIIVDLRRREVRKGGQSVTLTGREFEILSYLAIRCGEAVSRADLVAQIWGTKDDVEVSTRTVDQHVAALRRKLGDDPSNPQLLQTVYAHGYRLVRLGH